ncbi:TIM44-like domain-containing protein [Pseudodesulfovibrio sp. zrk46]|uniref:TIM44-like domain-containing protein n=1 Tax=Pseudodesulfovibrio sp. zrk46 TaxID=2725288 RepID=UPI001449EB4D|nr:TIM44-like domain-containing protein [Pseudodesulfovibrio sp. zrk46]QJB57962.1 TIM44-like domain-containing protein [Pseudodesulfovibrio sp. zrk46]
MPSAGGSVLNILFLGLIAYFLVRTFRRRMDKDDDNTRLGKWDRKNDDQDQGGRVIRPMDRHEAARQMWGHLSSDKNESSSVQGAPVNSDGQFDEAEFLEGAKLFFSRFQQARDSRDFDDLKVFLSDSVYSDALADAQRTSDMGPTEIMLLTARLMEMKSEGGRTLATVFYDAQLRRTAQGAQPMHVRAVWEFSRDDNVENGLWTLEKINKVDQ